MATEIELKLTLPAHAAKRVGKHPLLAAIMAKTQALPSTYFDTPTLQLTTLLVAVRLRRKEPEWLLTVKSAEPGSGGLATRSEWEVSSQPGNFDFSFVDQKDLRHRLDAVKHALTPIFTTHIERTTWDIHHGESRIELALDRGYIGSQGRQEKICELELELVDGQVNDLFSLAGILQESLPLHPAVASKAERGYLLFADQAPRPCKIAFSDIRSKHSPSKAFHNIALACLEQLQRNEIGIADPTQPEFLHQARVALRRLRSALRLFATALPEAFTARFDPQWRELARILGQARNLDVLRDETLPRLLKTVPETTTSQALQNKIAERASRAHAAAGRAMTSNDYSRLILDFSAALHQLPTSTTALPAFATEQLSSLAQRASKALPDDTNASAESLHQLRLRLKRLRYALEFFTPLLTKHGSKPYLAAIAKAQDQLGKINDLSSADLLLRHLGDKTLHQFYRNQLRKALRQRQEQLQQRLQTTLAHWHEQPRPWKHC